MPYNSQWWLSNDNAEKVDVEDMRDNNTKTRKVCVDGNKIALGKNGWYMFMPSSSVVYHNYYSTAQFQLDYFTCVTNA